MASKQVIHCCMLLVVVTAYTGVVHARPDGWQDDVTGVRRTLSKRQGTAAQTSSQPSSVSATDPDSWLSDGWKPNQPKPTELSATATRNSPDSQRRIDDGGATAAATETKQNTDGADSILNLSIDLGNIAASETESWRPSARSARRVSGNPISGDEQEREERRQRTRFAQNVHSSHLVASVSSDFQNGTFVGDLYGTENPWLQKYAPFYYPENPLPTTLNEMPDGPPPPQRLREVHIGDTVLVPPKVKYSNQVLRTIHDAKLRSLPKPREEVHIVEEEEEEEVFEEAGGYQEQPQEERMEEYGHEISGEVEKPSQYYANGDETGDIVAEYEWRPREAPDTGTPQSSGSGAQTGYSVNSTPDSGDSDLSSRPGPPYGPGPRPPPGFPFKQQGSVLVPSGPSLLPRPQTPSSPVRHSGQPSPTRLSPAPKPPVGYKHQPNHTPNTPTQHDSQRGPTQSNADQSPMVKHDSQPEPKRPNPAQNHGGGLFSPIRSQQRPTSQPAPKRIQARPAFHPPAAPSRQQSTVPSRVQPLRTPPSPTNIRTYRHRYRTTPQPTGRPEIVEDNGYSNTVKPDDVIPFSLSYGYEVVVATTTQAPPPISEYGKPKASTILGGPQAEESDESEEPTGPVAPVVSGRPLGAVDTSSTDGSDGFGAPKPDHVISGDVPSQIGQRNSPLPPQPVREGYTRPRDTGAAPPPPEAPRRDASSQQVTGSAGRPGYAAPKDADVINADERLAGERSRPLQALNLPGHQGNAPRGEDSRERKSDAEETTLGGYMGPKQDDILSDEQAAGFVRSRYFPKPAAIPQDPTDTEALNGFGSPKEENLVGNDPYDEFGIRTAAIQFETAPEGSESEAQSDYSRPKDADIVDFNTNSPFGGEAAPTAPRQPQGRRPEAPQTARGYSSPRPADLVNYNENSILNGDEAFSASGNPKPSRSIYDFGPKGYSKPKDSDVINAGDNSESTNGLETSSFKFETSKEPASQTAENIADVSSNVPTNLEHREELAPPTEYTKPRETDVIGGSDSGVPNTESSGEARPLVIDQSLVPQADGKPETLEVTPDVTGFGPVRSETVIQPQSGTYDTDTPAQSPTDKEGFGPPRPQHIVPETASTAEKGRHSAPPASTAAKTKGGRPDQPRDVRRPSTDLYTVDDFLRSEDVYILGAFRAPGSSRDTNAQADGIDVTTQRVRAAPKPVAARPVPVSSGWHRRSNPGPFRAQAALLDSQFTSFFVDELSPSRRRQPSRRPAVRRRPVATRRRPVEPQFGPPFVILESRADHGWPTAQHNEQIEPLTEERQSPPLKFGSAFAAEPLTPPSGRARKQPTVAPPRGRVRKQPTVATTRGRARQRSTEKPSRGWVRQRSTVAPRGGFPEQLSPFGADEFAAPFPAPAASRLSVRAVRPGTNPIPDWPKITEDW